VSTSTHTVHDPVIATSDPALKPRRRVEHIAVAIDGYRPASRDAAALGAAIARATGADLLLVTIQPAPVVVLPKGADWRSTRAHARATLAAVRDQFAPDARLKVKTDLSIARALQRTVDQHHRDLLVIGSSRKAAGGHVRIGKRTRQLLGVCQCPLALAPRGMSRHPDFSLARIGVGYDGGAESQAALEMAASIASSAGAELRVCCVVDDRMPSAGWTAMFGGGARAECQEIVETKKRSLRAQAAGVAHQLGANANTAATTGRPSDALLALSDEVDLLVIGSRCWGPPARVVLGSTGESVMFHASCAVLAVPRPVS
jgi:nucleotide-binding universal stress UspA family protein